MIYDRNYNLLVDNEAVKTIYYKKKSGVKAKEEIELAYTIGDNISNTKNFIERYAISISNFIIAHST